MEAETHQWRHNNTHSGDLPEERRQEEPAQDFPMSPFYGPLASLKGSEL